MTIALPGEPVLDTVAMIYFLAGDRRAEALRPVLQAAERGGMRPAVSAITFAEALVKPLRERDFEAEARVRLLLSLCDVIPVGEAVAETGGSVRARYPSMKLPDALVIGTAMVLGRPLVGNDAAFRQVREIHYIHLDDLG